MLKFSRCVSRCAGVALASATLAASATDPAKLAGNPALSGIVIEVEGAPSAQPPAVEQTKADSATTGKKPAAERLEAKKEAAREALRKRVTRIDHADGSTVYEYNDVLLESLVAHRGADGKLHVVCDEAAHKLGAATTQETANDR